MKKIYKKRLMKGLNLRKFFFSQRVVDNWNNLPARNKCQDSEPI